MGERGATLNRHALHEEVDVAGFGVTERPIGIVDVARRRSNVEDGEDWQRHPAGVSQG